MFEWKRENANKLGDIYTLSICCPVCHCCGKVFVQSLATEPTGSTMVALSSIGWLLYDVTRVFSAVLRLDGFR